MDTEAIAEFPPWKSGWWIGADRKMLRIRIRWVVVSVVRDIHGVAILSISIW